MKIASACADAASMAVTDWNLLLNARVWAALDFETATTKRDSACSVAVVRVEGGRIVERFDELIRPFEAHVTMTRIHGLRWSDLAGAARFGEVWTRAMGLLHGVEFVAAHNAGFDRSVMRAACARARVRRYGGPWWCSMILARRLWGIRPTKLPQVAAALGLPLVHHEAASDAAAVAGIIQAARADLGSAL